jgi:sec-independent protein translocase protein TatC
MSLGKHIEELRSRIINIVISIIIITIFSMSFGIKPLTINYNGANDNNLQLYYPYPDPLNNIAIQLTKHMQETLLPSEVKLIQTAPGQAFFSQIYVSLLIGIIGSMPIIIKEIYGFLSPAIENNDKKIGAFNLFFSMLSLFIIGSIFSYLLIIPFTLDFLYNYGQAIGVETFFNISDFISFVLQFLLTFGLAFELPVVMYAVTLTGVVDAKFWKDKFRYAIIILVIFGAIITPDGSGITMWFIVLPMLLLYVVGMYAITKREKRYLQA